MTKLVSFLVGSHFVPPAKVLLRAVPAGAEVELLDASDNPYDALAIRVGISAGELDASTLADLSFELAGCGTSPEEVLGFSYAQAESVLIPLGHVASSSGKPMAKARGSYPGLVGNVEIRKAMADLGLTFPLRAKLGFAGELILIELEGAEKPDGLGKGGESQHG